MLDKTCTKCGADLWSKARYQRVYACGRNETYDTPGCEGEPVRVDESLGCYRRQLAASERQVKVLERALDIASSPMPAESCPCEACDGTTADGCIRCVGAWAYALAETEQEDTDAREAWCSKNWERTQNSDDL